MPNKVTNYREVKYDFDTKLDALHWDEFMREVNFTTFDALGDYYAVYENLDEPDDHNRKKYAVYLHSTGELICLIADCGCALDCCYDDAEYMERRDELYKQIAMLAGWPKKIKPRQRYTVRISRVMDVEVCVDDEMQAEALGVKLATLANNRDPTWGKLVSVVMKDCNYEYEDKSLAEPEDDGVWDLSLNATECEQILKED